jgi:hypothetical protein
MSQVPLTKNALDKKITSCNFSQWWQLRLSGILLREFEAI